MDLCFSIDESFQKIDYENILYGDLKTPLKIKNIKMSSRNFLLAEIEEKDFITENFYYTVYFGNKKTTLIGNIYNVKNLNMVLSKKKIKLIKRILILDMMNTKI